MATPEHAPRGGQRIAAELGSSGNARLIRGVISELGGEPAELALDDAGQPAFDLAVLDPSTFPGLRERLAQCRRAAAPVVLPALMLVDGRRGVPEWVLAELGECVDDILRIPTTGAELRARISNLLRLRDLARTQQARYDEASAALAGANRALRTLHAANEVLVRAADEQDLLGRICRVIIDEESYQLAWAGFVRDGEEPTITIDAVAGNSPGYTEALTLPRSSTGDGPAWQAVDDGAPKVVADFRQAPVVVRLGLDVDRHGLASVITLPLCPRTGPAGVLAIYSRQRGDFRDDEREVLARLAANLEYGIDALRTGHERDRQKEVVEDLAYTDSLTGLPNRNHLLERLGALVDRDAPAGHVAALFIDLDGFKLINDALGHHAGDQVLRQVAQRLCQVVRPEDLVARQGGDEFIVVLAQPPRSEQWRRSVTESDGFVDAACALAQRLIARLREPIIVEGHERRLGASVGIGLHPEHARAASELIDCADTAMYAAKARDDRVQVYTGEIAQRRQRRLALEQQVHDAFEAGEFRLHYQPVFDLASGAIEGVEALLRWPQADGSYISPGTFMPVIEETGLIACLGDWVLRTAVAQRAAWLEAGHDLAMAVNVSVRQLDAADAAADLLAAVSEVVDDPARVELEITESGLIEAGGPINEALEAFHERGFGIAVDDFGTGHSSLSRLQALPLSTLKIDKSFVAELERGGRGAVIARTVQQLADGLGVRALAEGVETDRQRQRLCELGCRVGQGFWLSGAVPPEQVIPLVERMGAPGPGAGAARPS